MIWVLAIAVGFWWLGHWLRAPFAARWLMIAILYVAVLSAYLVLGQSNAWLVALGGSLVEWLLLGGAIVLVLIYRRVLAILRTRARQRAPQKSGGLFSPGEVERTARHIVLHEIGGAGQARLKRARVLVVGAGGLGSAALQYLAACGVGTIGVIDDDIVENSNLQRQVIHTDARIGMAKVFSAQAAMQAQNPQVSVRPYRRRLTDENARGIFEDYDLILDGTDNFETRYLVNRTCVALGKPLIAAAISQWEGQISTYHPASNGPCYQCVFPQAPALGLAPPCAEAGVLGPLPGVLGAMMAAEAVKELAQAGKSLCGRLMIYDALYGENRVISLKRDPDCAVCG
ncbi:HesA/MoeB/ThiF family protein [Rhodobacteraceae bacterium R_SAG10]|jgi:molybdopterin/thiamine biosynthesis adenylyltransferase|nr:HesA/MoeB/ThiF family protein [Rhodobacteraceae bacterium R_SAG10]